MTMDNGSWTMFKCGVHIPYGRFCMHVFFCLFIFAIL